MQNENERGQLKASHSFADIPHLNMDTEDLDDEIENERILKEIVLSMREFIPTAKRLCKAYFELYQLMEAGELE